MVSRASLVFMTMSGGFPLGVRGPSELDGWPFLCRLLIPGRQSLWPPLWRVPMVRGVTVVLFELITDNKYLLNWMQNIVDTTNARGES